MRKPKSYLLEKKTANYAGTWLDKPYLILLTIPFLLSTLMLIPFCACAPVNTPLVFHGTILYSPKVTPTPPPPIYGTNLAPIPMGTIPPSLRSTGISAWGDYNQHPTYIVNDESTDPQVCSLNYNVVHTPGSPSIQFGDGVTPRAKYDAHGKLVYALNDMNNYWMTVQGGDRVVMSAWIKTDVSEVGSGATIGVDLYGQTQRLWQVEASNPMDDFELPENYDDFVYVPYGSDWTLLTMDFIVPDKLFTTNDYGVARNPPEHVVGMIPWLGPSWNLGETATVWFADVELHIYRNGAWL